MVNIERNFEGNSYPWGSALVLRGTRRFRKIGKHPRKDNGSEGGRRKSGAGGDAEHARGDGDARKLLFLKNHFAPCVANTNS